MIGPAKQVVLLCPALASLLLAPLAAETDLTKPGETFVFAVDQASTDKPQTWTHRVAEAGDYQLGMAWVEVLSGGEVEVTIKARGKIVRSVKACPGLAPQRLDTRIGKLAAGDEITVIATPKAATCRLGYQVAFGTPTFPGAKIFRVKDFGAVGDGLTDDFAAIRKAVAAARDPDLGARVRPLPAANRFAADGFFVWCGAPVKEGENGLADLLTTSTSLDQRHQAA